MLFTFGNISQDVCVLPVTSLTQDVSGMDIYVSMTDSLHQQSYLRQVQNLFDQGRELCHSGAQGPRKRPRAHMCLSVASLPSSCCGHIQHALCRELLCQTGVPSRLGHQSAHGPSL